MEEDTFPIVYIKLATGRELVGELVKETKVELTVRKPMLITLVEQRSIAFFQLSQYNYTTTEVRFNARFVVERGIATDQLIELYNRYYDEPMEAIDPETIDDFINENYPNTDDPDDEIIPLNDSALESFEEFKALTKIKRQLH